MLTLFTLQLSGLMIENNTIFTTV